MKKIIPIIIILITHIYTAQVTISVQTEKGKRDFYENEPIIINVILEIKGKELQQQTPLRLFSTTPFEIIASGTEQTIYTDEKTGHTTKKIHYQTLLKAKKVGKYKIGSASVEVNDKIYHTEPFDIQINEAHQYTENKNEPTIKLTVDNSTPHKNQKIIATVTAYAKNIDALKKIKKIIPPNNPQIKILYTDNTKEIIQKQEDIHSQIIATLIIEPTTHGNIKIPPIQFNTKINNHTKITSNPITLQVTNTPQTQKQTDIVGDYKINITTNEKDNPTIGKPYHITIKIKGHGNINENTIPKLKNNNKYQVYTPKITHNKTKKETKIEYIIIPKTTGKTTIETEPITYYNIKNKKNTNLKTPKININITQQENIQNTPISISTKKQQKINNYTKNNHQIKTWYNTHTTEIITITIAIILAIITIKYKNKKNKTQNKKYTENHNAQKEINEYIDQMYLETTNKNYTKYFQIFNNINETIKKQLSAKNNQEIINKLEKTYGTNIAEKYEKIQQKINIEKYAPHHQIEHLYELTTELKNIIKQIYTNNHTPK